MPTGRSTRPKVLDVMTSSISRRPSVQPRMASAPPMVTNATPASPMPTTSLARSTTAALWVFTHSPTARAAARTFPIRGVTTGRSALPISTAVSWSCPRSAFMRFWKLPAVRVASPTAPWPVMAR